MGYQTKVQQIKRVKSEQWYINLPAQLAQAMQFEQSETVEWFIEDKATLALKRHKIPEPVLKKNTRFSGHIQQALFSNPIGIQTRTGF